MSRFRSIVAWLLVVVTTFVISCGSATAATKATPSYTAEQIKQIQVYAPRVEATREQMDKLQTLIQQKRWVDVGTFIHGPLGELRRNMNNLAYKLNPQDKKAAIETAKDFYNDLVRLGQAANDADYQQAVSNFRSAVQEFDAFLRLIPGQG